MPNNDKGSNNSRGKALGKFSRREALALSGALLPVGFAGCTGDSDSSPTDTESPTPTPEPSVNINWENEYPIDEGSGSKITDRAGQTSNDGTIDGATWGTDEETGGENNTVLNFDGDDSVTTSADHIHGADQFSQIMYVKFNAKGSDRALSSTWNGEQDAYGHLLWYDEGTGSISWITYTPDEENHRAKETGVSPPLDEWVQIAWTYDNGDFKLFYNGEQAASLDGDGFPINDVSTDRLICGGYGHPGFDGSLHSVYESLSVVSPEKIAAHYEAFNS